MFKYGRLFAVIEIQKHNKQKQVCLLLGREAKNSTRHTVAQLRWRVTHSLYWQGKRINRFSDEYKKLLDRVYDMLSENEEFQNALKDSSSYILTHSIGKRDMQKTILTEFEFVLRLERLRKNTEWSSLI